MGDNDLKEKRYTSTGHQVFMKAMKKANKSWSDPAFPWSTIYVPIMGGPASRLKRNVFTVSQMPLQKQTRKAYCSSKNAPEAVASEAPVVYESQPSRRIVDACHTDGSQTAAARTLIESAADAAAMVFESTPASASADASSSHGAASAESMVFESKPQESKADALHRAGTRIAADAEELIQSAADLWTSGQNLVYENTPAASDAHVSHASLPEAPTASVYESSPAASRADFISGNACLADSARTLIEDAAAQAEPTMPKPKTPSAAAARATEARDTIEKVAASELSIGQSGACVFESQPAESMASACHGKDYSSGEEVTDDEEDDTKA
eukprot:s2578_g11.t1